MEIFRGSCPTKYSIQHWYPTIFTSSLKFYFRLINGIAKKIWQHNLEVHFDSIEIQSSKSRICWCYGCDTLSLENEFFLTIKYHHL